ncbi:LOW QUALITY PROTEIN: hypothetical protein V2J09_018471 [Rumex salicifolius]
MSARIWRMLLALRVGLVSPTIWYLGVPLFHKRVTKATFMGLIEQIVNSMVGGAGFSIWLGHPYVLNAIPIYTMNIVLLPTSTCQKIDKLCRDLVWGNFKGSRRMNLVSREEGSLGIRTVASMNLASIGKLGCPLDQALATKYKVGVGNAYEVSLSRKADSPTWKAIMKGIREDDKWLLSRPLTELATAQIPKELQSVRVRDLWNSYLGWRWDRLAELLPPSILLQLAATGLSGNVDEVDVVRWDHIVDLGQKALLKITWKLPLLEKIQNFMWLVLKGKLFSNVGRVRRHMSQDSECKVCNAGDESLLHFLRDCSQIRHVWLSLIPDRYRADFFNLDEQPWLKKNLQANEEVSLGCDWNSVFAITIWWAWKWRNSIIFRDPNTSGHRHLWNNLGTPKVHARAFRRSKRC